MMRASPTIRAPWSISPMVDPPICAACCNAVLATPLHLAHLLQLLPVASISSNIEDGRLRAQKTMRSMPC